MKKILIDTDIGGDVDDALALVMALNSSELDIVAITNVYLANAWRAGVTHRILQTWGVDDRIPVAAGAEKPLIGWWSDDHHPRPLDSFGTFRGEELPCAADVIVQAAKQYEGLTIVAMGPMTNVALALAKDPEIAERVEIVMMGGQIDRAVPEWNILCDPEAARAVFESGARITMVGKDVTDRCQFTREEVDAISEADNPRSRLLGEMMAVFMEKWGYLPILHDPLAMSVLLWEDILILEEKRVLIETRGEFTRGVSVDCTWDDGAKVLVATDVRVQEFKNRVVEMLRK